MITQIGIVFFFGPKKGKFREIKHKLVTYFLHHKTRNSPDNISW